MKKLLFTALGLALLAAPASAVSIELGLVIDRSSSLNPSDFAHQRSGYVSALNAVLPTDGSVAVGVWSFGATSDEHFALTTIANDNDRAQLVSVIAGITQSRREEGTALGTAIEDATAAMLAFDDGTDPRQVIDISTDGLGNLGTPQVTAANSAILAGVDQINGLGMGPSAVLDFVAGNGSFSIQVDDLEDFEAALIQKLQREIGITSSTPEPGTVALFGLGLGGLALAIRRRRRRAAA